MVITYHKIFVFSQFDRLFCLTGIFNIRYVNLVRQFFTIDKYCSICDLYRFSRKSDDTLHGKMPVLLLTEGHDIPSGRTFDMINCTIDQQDIPVPECRSHRIPCRTHSLSESRYQKNCQHTGEKELHSPYNNIFCPDPAPAQFLLSEMQRCLSVLKTKTAAGCLSSRSARLYRLSAITVSPLSAEI